MSKNYDDLIKSITNQKEVESLLNKNQELKKDADFFLALLRGKLIDENTLGFFSEEVKGNRKLVLELVDTWPHQDGFKHASKKLKDDKDVAYAAISGKDTNVEYISDRLKDDYDFMLNVVSTIYFNNKILKYLPEKYRSNREFLMILLKKDYQSIEFIDNSLKDDEELILNAMFSSNVWYAPLTVYKNASLKIQGNKDFFKKVMEKVKGYRSSKELISEMKEIHKVAFASSKGQAAGDLAKIKSSLKAFKKEISESSGYGTEKTYKSFDDFLESDCKNFSGDKKIMELAIEVDMLKKDYYSKKIGKSFEIIDKSLLLDDLFLAKIMSITEGRVFKYLPIETKNNKTFILNNYSSNISSSDLSDEIRKDGTFFIDLLRLLKENNKSNYGVKKILGDSLLKDKKFISSYVVYDGSVLENCSEDIKKDISIVKKAIKSYSNALSDADKSLLDNEELMIYSLKEGGDFFVSKLSLDQLNNKELMIKLAKASSSSGVRSIMRSIGYNLKKDKEIVSICVAKNGWALESADDSIKYDKDILTLAFKSGCHVYKDLDMDKLKEMYTDKELKKIMGNLHQFLK